jgi:hypothetical protein
MAWMLVVHLFIFVHHLERMINNMGQSFGREKHFYVQTTLKPFSSQNIIPKEIHKIHKLNK